ncbi:hypothetical protein IH992_24810 [Candidatus Poribacteria bacterium]|nr:hypothetical protein [Candidatus Poribacteria bacterium]
MKSISTNLSFSLYIRVRNPMELMGTHNSIYPTARLPVLAKAELETAALSPFHRLETCLRFFAVV